MGTFLVLHCFATIALALTIFSIWPNPVTFVVAVMVIGSRQLGLAILMHDAAHRALFANDFLNEKIGYWVCGAPILADMFAYRHYHLMHHKHTQTDKDPEPAVQPSLTGGEKPGQHRPAPGQLRLPECRVGQNHHAGSTGRLLRPVSQQAGRVKCVTGHRQQKRPVRKTPGTGAGNPGTMLSTIPGAVQRCL